MIVGDYSARKAHPVLMPSSTGVRFLPGQSATPKLLFSVSWLSSQISVEVAWSPLSAASRDYSRLTSYPSVIQYRRELADDPD
jgi:hypothetical protein